MIIKFPSWWDFITQQKPFTVPLTTEVKDLINSLKRVRASDYLFPSPINLDQPIAEGTLLPYFQKKMDYPEYTVHGFRSSLRTWVAEATAYPWEVAEYALSHSVGSKVEKAYARTDMFKERAKLMEDWARFITGGKKYKLVQIMWIPLAAMWGASWILSWLR